MKWPIVGAAGRGRASSVTMTVTVTVTVTVTAAAFGEAIVTFATNGAWHAKCKCNSCILLNFKLRAQSSKSLAIEAPPSPASALQTALQTSLQPRRLLPFVSF